MYSPFSHVLEQGLTHFAPFWVTRAAGGPLCRITRSNPYRQSADTSGLLRGLCGNISTYSIVRLTIE
jgi:hypothetical protein